MVLDGAGCFFSVSSSVTSTVSFWESYLGSVLEGSIKQSIRSVQYPLLDASLV